MYGQYQKLFWGLFTRDQRFQSWWKRSRKEKIDWSTHFFYSVEKPDFDSYQQAPRYINTARLHWTRVLLVDNSQSAPARLVFSVHHAWATYCYNNGCQSSRRRRMDRWVVEPQHLTVHWILSSAIHRCLAPFWGCCDEPLLCCRAIFLPGGLFGRNAQRIDGSSCPVMCGIFCALRYAGVPCLIHMDKRKRLRDKYGLPAEPCNDCLTTTFCAECALVQERRELDFRGSSSFIPLINAFCLDF